MASTTVKIVIMASNRASGPIADVGKAVAKTTEQTSRFQRTLRTLANANLALNGVAQAGRMAARALMAPVNVAAEFEDKMARVGALSDATSEDMAKLTGTARKLGKETRFSAIQAAEGMEFLATAGFTVQQQMDALPGVLAVAAANSTDLGRTAEIAADALHGFGLEARDMGRVGDVLTKAAADSTTDLSGLGEALKYVGPVARTAGADIEDAAAAVGLLANVGIKGSSAGTALRAMFLRLAAPTGKLKRQAEDAGDDPANVGRGRDALKFLGIDPNDKQGNVRPFAQLLTEINTAVKAKALGSGDKLALYKKIFGEEAATAAAELVERAGDGALDGMIDKLRESEGITARLAARMNNTASGAFENLRGAVEDVGIEVGNALIPTMRNLSRELVDSSEELGKWASENKQDLETLGEVIGGIASGMLSLVKLTAQAYAGLAKFGKGLGDSFSNSEAFDNALITFGRITGQEDLVDLAKQNKLRRETLAANGPVEYSNPEPPAEPETPTEETAKAGRGMRPMRFEDAMKRAREAGIKGEENQRKYAQELYGMKMEPGNGHVGGALAGAPAVGTVSKAGAPATGEVTQLPAVNIDVAVELQDKRTVATVKQRDRGNRVSTAAGPAVPTGTP